MNYLFVHGACHTAACWDEVLKHVRQAGETAEAIDLPGHRWESRRASIVFKDYPQAVVDYILRKNWHEVVLVGHSMAGPVLQKAAGIIPDRLAGLVFLAAYVLADGESFLDNSLEFHKRIFRESAAGSPDNSIFFPPLIFRKYFANLLPKAEALKVHRKLVRTPYAPLKERLNLRRFYRLALPMCYIGCTHDKLFPSRQGLEKFSGRIKSSAIEIKADHEAMFSAPRICAEAVLKAARFQV